MERSRGGQKIQRKKRSVARGKVKKEVDLGVYLMKVGWSLKW